MNILKDYYIRLSRFDKSVLRDSLMKACGWSYGTFYYKLSHNNLSRLERKAIKEIILSYQ
jgi:hypothetical protein